MGYVFYVGLLGMAIILLAFVLNVFGRVKSSSTQFLGLNFAGSVLLSTYALLIVSIPFLILNIVWAAVALWGIQHHHGR